MRLVLATFSLRGVGGTETYALTIADQLQRLGHDVWLYTRERGSGSELAAELGLRVAERPPASPDAVVVQDGAVACELAAAYPQTPQVFVAHSDVFDVQLPPPHVEAVVVMYDRVERRIRALAGQHEIVRLTQPVDVERFSSLRPLRERPRVALAFGHYVRGERLALLGRACERAGMELHDTATNAPRRPLRSARARRLAYRAGTRLGGERLARLGLGLGPSEYSAAQVLNEADIVFGKARVIHEAMACGRAAYVFGPNGADGWVTPERYPALVADNFGGQSDTTRTEDELVADLAGYDPEMGVANRDLVLTHHAASKHAAALVAVCERLAPRAAPLAGPFEELARVYRLLYRAEGRAFTMVAETERLGARIHALEQELERGRRS